MLASFAAASATCLILSVTMLYTAGGLAAAQTTRYIPFVGDQVSGQIQSWVLGAEMPHTIDDAPLPPEGTPVSAVTPMATPQPGDPNCAKPYVYPVSGPVTSRFGWRTSPFPPFRSELHAGIDFSAPTGTGVYATMCGTVTFAGWSDLYGWQVSVSNSADGQAITTLYGHNSQLMVAEGQQVQVGTLLALSGSTGRSTAPHVHYGISINGVWVDPEVAFGIG